MSYYPTIEEDLQRAKDILARGKVIPPTPNLPIPIPEKDFGGTIYAMDDFAAYKLLESFVAEIEKLTEQLRQVLAGKVELREDLKVASERVLTLELENQQLRSRIGHPVE